MTLLYCQLTWILGLRKLEAIAYRSLGEGLEKNRRVLLREKTRSPLYNQHIRLEVIKKGALDLTNTPYSDRTFNFLARWAILASLKREKPPQNGKAISTELLNSYFHN